MPSQCRTENYLYSKRSYGCHLFIWDMFQCLHPKVSMKGSQNPILAFFLKHPVAKLATLCFFLFLLHLQTLPTIFFIETISNTYQMHIHFRSNLYPLHILFYQNNPFCAFPVFTPIPHHVNSWFHWYSIKNRFIFIT